MLGRINFCGTPSLTLRNSDQLARVGIWNHLIIMRHTRTRFRFKMKKKNQSISKYIAEFLTQQKNWELKAKQVYM